MTRRTITTLVLIASFATLGSTAAGPSIVQEDLDQATSLVKEAQALAREGRTADALALLDQGDEVIRSAEGRAVVDFTRGWLSQKTARESPDAALTSLEEAIEHYESVLEVFDDHPQATRMLHEARLELGDASVRAGSDHLRRAYRQFELAMQSRPDDSRPPARIVSMYALLPASWSNRFLETCATIDENGHRSLASHGYALIVQTRAATEHDDAAVVALERWVEIEGEQGTFGGESLKCLPATERWKNDGLSELTAILSAETEAELAEVQLSFWRQSARREHALAAALRSLGASSSRQGQVAWAERLYRYARRIAPGFDAYRKGGTLHGHPMVSLELASDLAALYNAHPELNDRGQFHRLEEELLNEKNSAYLEGDLPAIEQFHIVIGVIYARDPERWEGGGIRSAPYHLERAVAVAQRREGRASEEYQPHPRLTHRLAEGMQLRDPDFAREKYIEAAMGYLDQNAFSASEKSIVAAENLSDRLGAPPPPKLDALKAVLDARRSVPNVGSLDHRAPVAFDEGPPGEGDGLSPIYVNRQATRFYVDLRDRAYELGDAEAASELQRAAALRLMDAPHATSADVTNVLRDPRWGQGMQPVVVTTTRSDPEQRVDPSTYQPALAHMLRHDRIVGGKGGRPFEDRVPKGARMSRIIIGADQYVTSIRIESSSGSTPKLHARHGGDGGRVSEIKLQRGEHVIGISGRYDRFVDSINIHTNQRELGPFGGPGGEHTFDLRAPKGGVVVGFKGRSGALIDAIGIITTGGDRPQPPRR